MAQIILSKKIQVCKVLPQEQLLEFQSGGGGQRRLDYLPSTKLHFVRNGGSSGAAFFIAPPDRRIQ
jgi:hypothetical protein